MERLISPVPGSNWEESLMTTSPLTVMSQVQISSVQSSDPAYAEPLDTNASGSAPRVSSVLLNAYRRAFV